MAGKTNFLEAEQLNAYFRRRQFTVAGANASTTNIQVSSSTGGVIGQIIKGSAAGSYHEVTAIPDGTHVTVTPAFAAAPTTGTLDVMAYRPKDIYIGLFTANPTDAGGGTEASGGNYARQQVTHADASWSAPAGTPRAIENSAAIQWTGVTWSGTVTGFGIFDSLTTGNLLFWCDSTDKVVNVSDDVRFAAGALDISED